MKFLFFIVLNLTLFACNGQNTGTKKVIQPVENKAVVTKVPSFKENIDVAEAKSLMKATKEIILLDVRTPQEIAQGKIKNAMEIDYSSPDFKEKVNKLNKNTEYIVYCAAGGRSARAVSLMKELGFTKAHNLTPGYSGWSKTK